MNETATPTVGSEVTPDPDPMRPEDIMVYVEQIADKWYVVPVAMPGDYDDIWCVHEDRSHAISKVKRLVAERANLELARANRMLMPKVGEIL